MQQETKTKVILTAKQLALPVALGVIFYSAGVNVEGMHNGLPSVVTASGFSSFSVGMVFGFAFRGIVGTVKVIASYFK